MPTAPDLDNDLEIELTTEKSLIRLSGVRLDLVYRARLTRPFHCMSIGPTSPDTVAPNDTDRLNKLSTAQPCRTGLPD